MSNIEPTCSSCGRHATVVDPRNDAMRCVDYPKCDFPKPTTIEPTEEQKQAAREFYDGPDADRMTEALARLLAEREAKLREELDANIRLRVAAEERTRLLQGLANTARAEADTLQARLREWRGLVDMHMNDANTLRARVAELEALEHAAATCAEQIDEIAELYRREAQHLADIEALMEVLNDGLNDPNDIGEEAARDAAEALLQRLAHYDDAKADAPAVRGAPFDEDLTRTEGGEG